MFVEKKNKRGYWEGLLGPNPMIENELLYAKWARDRGEEKKALDHEQRSADIASGAYLTKVTSPHEISWYAPKVFEGWLCNGRNYDLFAILGNVRNGSGFAGIQTGEGFNYISDCRGLPDDCSDDIADKLGRDEDFYHSVSYVTLRELVEFDWNQATTHYGVVGEEEYKVWKETGKPKSWSGGVSGQNVEHISNEEMDALIAGTKEPQAGKNYYTRVSWEEYYYESVGDFYTKSIPQLKELSELTDLSDIRVVFGFDS